MSNSVADTCSFIQNKCKMSLPQILKRNTSDLLLLLLFLISTSMLHGNLKEDFSTAIL